MNFIQNLRNLTRHSAIYAVSTVLQRLIGLLLLPFLTDPRYVESKAAFGDYSLYFALTVFLNFFFLYGMDVALLRYSALSKKPTKEVFSTVFFTILSSGFFFLLFFALFRDSLGAFVFKSEDGSYFIVLALSLVLVDALCNLPYLLLRIREQSGTFAAVKVGRFLLELFLGLFFVVYLQTGWIGIVYGNLLAATLNMLLLIGMQRREFMWYYDFRLVKEMLPFAMPFLFGGIAYATIETVDRFLLSEILGKAEMALYSANRKFGMVMAVFIFAFRNAWQPFFLRLAKNDDAPKMIARILYIYVAVSGLWLVSSALFVPAFISSSLFAGKSFLHSQYWSGMGIIPIILSGYFFFGLYIFFSHGLVITKRNRWLSVFAALGALLNISANSLLIRPLGIYGAAWAFAAAFLFMAIAIIIYNQQIYPLPINWRRLAGFLLPLLLAMLSLLYALPLWLRFLLLASLPLAFYIAGGFSRQEIKDMVNLRYLLRSTNRP
jgi:O-antigen/teichoic acid export membrane protein